MEWDIDYDFKQQQINASTALLNFHYGAFTIGGGDAFLQAAGAGHNRGQALLLQSNRSISFVYCWDMDISASVASAGPPPSDMTLI